MPEPLNYLSISLIFADLDAMVASSGTSTPPRVDGGIYYVSNAGGLAQGRWVQYLAGSTATATEGAILMPADGVGRWHLALAAGGGSEPGGGGGELATDLVFWYKFDGDLTDSSGNGLTLTKQGGGALAFAASGLDNALDLSARDYAVSVADPLPNAQSQGFYFAVVARSPFGDMSNNVQLINQDFGFSGGKFALFVRSTQVFRLVLMRDDGGNSGFIDVALPPAGQDFLVEIYYDPSESNGDPVEDFGRFGIAINNGDFVKDDVYVPIGSESYPLYIGGTEAYKTPRALDLANIWQDKIEMAAGWSVPFADKSPTGPERAALWNGGNFRSDP